MQLDYNLDIKKNSIWKIATPILEPGSFPFFVNEVGLFDAGQRYFTQRADKDDLLLIFTIEGEGELSYEGLNLELGEGSACLINCNHPHRYRTAIGKGGQWVFYWMHIASPFGERYYDLLNSKGCSPCHIGRDSELVDCFLRAMELIDYATATTCCEISHCVSAILTKLITVSSENLLGCEQNKTIHMAMDYLKSNFAQPFNLDEMAHELGLSKYYFIKLFSKHTGVTPYQYLIMHRIVKAKQMLRSTDYKISEIGRAVGFLDESNFCRTFNRIIGMPPSQYRKMD